MTTTTQTATPFRISSKEEYDEKFTVIARKKGVRFLRDRPANGQVSDWTSVELVLVHDTQNQLFCGVSVYYHWGEWQSLWYPLLVNKGDTDPHKLLQNLSFFPDQLLE